MLGQKVLLLGVTGSIAIYKAVDLASKLTQRGALVDVVMTQSATRFVTPLSFRSVTHRQVYKDMWDEPVELEIEHISLAERANMVVIAPATANMIAKLATGIADDLLSCIVLATKAPVLLAPAMNVNMYENHVTQDNLAKLRARGFKIIEPGTGILACGATGAGRLADMEQIMATIVETLETPQDLTGQHIVITAGGTQEPIDPVRHISNRSSGKMGYALAQAARDRGAEVSLISGPVNLPGPAGVRVLCVQTALQMKDAVMQAVRNADALIMAAAVADYRPAEAAASKIKKEDQAEKFLHLVRNPDIISEVKEEVLKVGFAAESEDLLENAISKIQSKGLDFIVANDITSNDSGFDVDNNRVTLIDRQGSREDLPLMSKLDVAHRILDRVVALLATRELGN